MIGSIRGKVALKTDKFLIVDVNGVGYKIHTSPDTMLQAQMNADISVFVHTYVREDSIDLYGFRAREEQEFFEMLISVSGIGPRGALSILGIATLETLRKAIVTGDTAYLTKVSGIGKKTAEKIIIELRDKVGEEQSGSLQGELDALEALKSLGYSQHEAREALKKVKSEDTNGKVKEALKILGQSK